MSADRSQSKKRCSVALVLSACVATIVAGGRRAAGQCELAELVPSDSENNHFGSAVGLSGDRLLIGAPLDDEIGDNAGAVYAFALQQIQWVEEAKLLAEDGLVDDRFGYTLDMSTDVAVVGAPWSDDHGSKSGSAYIFGRTERTWHQQQKLTSPTQLAEGEFGSAVALFDGLVFIGAPGEAAVHVFLFDASSETWQHSWTIESPGDVLKAAEFGSALATDGHSLIVGSPRHIGNGADAGAAYIYRPIDNTPAWYLQASIVGSDTGEGDRFGTAVDVTGDVAVVGAPSEWQWPNGPTGAAYIFQFDRALEQWIERAILRPQDLEALDMFGDAVAIRDDVAIVGAPEHDLFTSEGAAYLFRGDPEGFTWTQRAKLFSIGAENLGVSVAMDGDFAVIGADDSDTAYVFDLQAADTDINNNGIADACEEIADLNVDGFVDSADLLILLGFWGACAEPPHECLGDLNADGGVDSNDLIILLGNWT